MIHIDDHDFSEEIIWGEFQKNGTAQLQYGELSDNRFETFDRLTFGWDAEAKDFDDQGYIGFWAGYGCAGGHLDDMCNIPDAELEKIMPGVKGQWNCSESFHIIDLTKPAQETMNDIMAAFTAHGFIFDV